MTSCLMWSNGLMGNVGVAKHEQITMSGRVLVFGCSAVLVGATLAFAPSAAATDCPYGTVPTSFIGVCVEGQAGGFGAPGLVVPPDASAPSVDWQMPPGELPTVDVIPCTPQYIGTCIGLQQSQG